jgi:hypothetical protein
LLAGDSFQVQARLQPWGSSSSVSVTTQIGASVGSDRVTFGVGRADPVWVNGNPSTLSTTNPLISLNGGTLLELSPNSYEIKWNTGGALGHRVRFLPQSLDRAADQSLSRFARGTFSR